MKSSEDSTSAPGEENRGALPGGEAVRPTPADLGTEVTVSAKRAVRRARWAELAFGVTLCLYAFLAALAHRYAYFEWDLRLARFIQSVDIFGFRELMIWVSALGSGWLSVALVVCAGLLLVAARFRVEGIVCMFGAALGSLVNHLAKAVIARPRPDRSLVQVVSEYRFDSFPSGHVVYFVDFFGFLLFLSYVLFRPSRLRRTSVVILGALIALVGVSRVYLGAHWPSDVAGAYLAGGLWLMLMIEAYRRMKARRRAKVFNKQRGFKFRDDMDLPGRQGEP